MSKVNEVVIEVNNASRKSQIANRMCYRLRSDEMMNDDE